MQRFHNSNKVRFASVFIVAIQDTELSKPVQKIKNVLSKWHGYFIDKCRHIIFYIKFIQLKNNFLQNSSNFFELFLLWIFKQFSSSSCSIILLSSGLIVLQPLLLLNQVIALSMYHFTSIVRSAVLPSLEATWNSASTKNKLNRKTKFRLTLINSFSCCLSLVAIAEEILSLKFD